MKEPKKPAVMSAAEINRELDRLDAQDSALGDEIIAAGLGHVLLLDLLKMEGELPTRARAIFDRRHDLRHEITARYGPNAPARLPRGMGPIKGAL